MKKFQLAVTLFFFYAALSLSVPAVAAEPKFSEDGQNHLRANLRRLSLDVSSTSVSNAKAYQNSPNSSLSSDSEAVTKGVLDFILEYEMPNAQWNNSIFAEYGKTRLKNADGQTSSSETADKILLTTDYARKVWTYKDANVGPFASLGYQTEFTANDDAPPNQSHSGQRRHQTL